jgi:hypothetical protein
VLTLTYDTAIHKHLLPGEQLLWVGRPRQGWAYRWSNRLFLVQLAVGVMSLVWLAEIANWGASALGIDLRLPLGRPSLRFSTMVMFLGGVTMWQLYRDRRRRAGTWYAVTDRRVLFVLTSVTPQSVIGVEFDEIASVSLNAGMDVLAPLNAVILRLKSVDPYLLNSKVLGYQMGNNLIVLEALEEPQEFCERVRRRARSGGVKDE